MGGRELQISFMAFILIFSSKFLIGIQQNIHQDNLISPREFFYYNSIFIFIYLYLVYIDAQSFGPNFFMATKF